MIWLQRIGMYGALASALLLAGFWWGKTDALKDAAEAIRIAKEKHIRESIETSKRVQAAEDRANQEFRRADNYARLLKQHDKAFATWDDTPVPDAVLGLVWGDLSAEPEHRRIADPAARLPGAPGERGER